MKTGHEKRTSEGSIVFAGTDASSSHLVTRKAKITKGEWPHNVKKRLPSAKGGRTHYDVREWSLMISLIRRLEFTQAPSAGRSFNEMRGSYAFCLDHVLLQSTKIQMKPRFVLAALIIWSQAECFPRDGESTMFVHFPKALRAGRFEKSTDVCPIVRYGSRPPQCCGARWWRQDTVQKCFVNSTEVVFAAVPPSSTIEITCNQVNFLRNHNGTKSENEFLGDAFLLGVDVADRRERAL